jgi:4'-phosphopantetheinyl transferase
VAAWPTPAEDEVHLWQARLDVSPEELAQLATTLSEPELDRSRAFRFERDRARFIAGRGQLRLLLGGYLDTRGSEIALVEGPNGKPRLAGGTALLRFNLAHSDDVVVFAVAWNREVGVDVERIRSDFPVDQVARHHFSPKERRDLAGLLEGDRLRAAFDCWTRKEAYLKASGVGLTVPLDGFDVTVRPGEPVRLSRPDAKSAASWSWSLHAFDAGPDYAAAVAVEGPSCNAPTAARRLGPTVA